MNIGKILVVDDEKGMRDLLRKVLSKEGYEVILAEDGEEGLTLIKENAFDIVIADLDMPVMNGIEMIKRAKDFDPNITIIIITAYASIESAVEALKLGAYDYLIKPFEIDELKIIVKKAMERINLVSENIYLKQEIEEKFYFPGVIGKSESMEKVFELIDAVSKTDSLVLIEGESGTGKELIAKAIHQNSRRRNNPFIVLNCGALSEGVLESELFGHERGSFSGAFTQRKGRFELAHTGTLFIDEIGELSLSAQTRLLRVLQEKEFERVGGNHPIKVDVRIITATNKNLEKEVKENRFREDLYYRLNVFKINVPPLRDRKEDIVELAGFFITRFSKDMNKGVKGLSPEAVRMLKNYSWPGNIRELQNVIERAVVLCKDEIITPRELPENLSKEAELRDQVEIKSGETLDDAIERIEKSIILKALKKCDFSQTKTAEYLGVKRTTLRYKLEKYGFISKVVE
ncbi:MAG: sigma-54 dependent transcriptional regulator, partial [Proteobacteria bacterium]|nr:sigma-54 dependent transcriptional regulator [Pseudomonadota bacterium]